MNELNVIATARYLAAESVDYVVEQWKMSNEEAKALRLLVSYRDRKFEDDRYNTDTLTRAVMYGYLTSNEADLLLQFDQNYVELARWRAIGLPTFPVNGNDILQAGVPVGKPVGAALSKLRDVWVQSGYTASKEQLLALIP